MNYFNISIVHLEKGIDVSFNGNESNREIVFFFDDNRNYIQNITYPVEIHFDNVSNIIEDTKEKICINEKCFLYYSFYYQVSYAHYLTQCVPKLKYYMNDMSRTLVIPKSTYNKFCKDILSILGISEEKILVLEDNIEYVFDDISTVEHIGPQWNGVGGEINLDGIDVYKKIRSSLGLGCNTNPHRKVYLKRDGKSNSSYGNGEVGIFRKIDNEHELISLLVDQGFEIIELGTKTIEEKRYELRDVRILVSQIGANLMNLIFCNSLKNVLLLSNEYPLGSEYYFGLIDYLNPISANKEIFTHLSSHSGVDSKNITNNPFVVDIHRIKNYLQSLN